ncbi:[Fe-S]-binding protein [Anaerobacillus arseniciselenatis]|uniref:[Fe-S]-binding protein n=1 Tax=Anaerobacillus arseniciselenatis TaxID=85682 RepID=A0A1S2LMM8_9BACI|nr:DUF1284 domain-containing protein [Anaerobacillus arseniciselenatis]OIJ12937.1 [Fe-S]-binding protein [Anaerobacillus arseniciselenatis]
MGAIRTLRGHHLLCVHGFQGMGYSDDFVKLMEAIVAEIRNEQIDFPVQVVASLDDACGACPHNGGTICISSEGSDQHVKTMDQKVIEHLQLQAGKTYQKSDLIQLTAKRVEPDDLDHLCHGCSWLSYGVCKAGIAKLNKLKR